MNLVHTLIKYSSKLIELETNCSCASLPESVVTEGN